MDWDDDWEENRNWCKEPKKPPKIVNGDVRDKKIEELRQANNRYEVVRKTLKELENESHELYYKIKRLEYITQHLDRCEKCMRWRGMLCTSGSCPHYVNGNITHPMWSSTEKNGCKDFIKCSWA